MSHRLNSDLRLELAESRYVLVKIWKRDTMRPARDKLAERMAYRTDTRGRMATLWSPGSRYRAPGLYKLAGR